MAQPNDLITQGLGFDPSRYEFIYAADDEDFDEVSLSSLEANGWRVVGLDAHDPDTTILCRRLASQPEDLITKDDEIQEWREQYNLMQEKAVDATQRLHAAQAKLAQVEAAADQLEHMDVQWMSFGEDRKWAREMYDTVAKLMRATLADATPGPAPSTDDAGGPPLWPTPSYEELKLARNAAEIAAHYSAEEVEKLRAENDALRAQLAAAQDAVRHWRDEADWARAEQGQNKPQDTQDSPVTPRNAQDDLSERLAAAVALLRKVEWCAEAYAYDDPSAGCPICGQADWVGHTETCELAALLAGEGGEVW